ncbi:hypothetical protein [Blastococcus sp. URHD0036]|uniref:hypothetical protein n=1 Tax=Blastococcus sp. URHD0036 TaxID=1380356 RepID=UPI000495A440|nr:hypothetical protein [Blastococcus sp. URHD0036]
MGEKGNWAPGPAASDVLGKGTGSLPATADGKGFETAFDSKGLSAPADAAKGAASPADAAKGFSSASDAAKGTGGDGRSAGLPPLGGVLRRRDGGDGPGSGPES